MPSRATLSYADYDSEVGTVSLRGADLTAVNFDAQVTALATLAASIASITLGAQLSNTLARNNIVGIGPASDPAAQRETKWLVQYHDDVTFKRYTAEIPCADHDQLDPNDRAHAHIGDGSVVDQFVTDFEAFVVSEAGNAVTIDEITLVGRNV